MKAIDALKTRTGQVLLALAGALLVLFFLGIFELSEFGWAAYSTIGAAYMTAHIRLHPHLWRSRGGSLLPAICLLAVTWIAAAVAIAVALLSGH